MKKMKELKDGQQFTLSNRKGAAVYQLIKKIDSKKKCVYNSLKSNLSFTRSWATLVNPKN